MKTKRTKKYIPKTVLLDPMSWAAAGVFTFPIATQKEIMKGAQLSFDLLRQGTAGREDWNVICQALNTGEALCEFNIGNNLIDYFNAGHEALHQIALRMLGGKSSTCYSSELSAISEAINMHRIQLTLCTQAEFSRAVKRVKNLINGGAQDDVAKTYARLNGVTA